MLYYTCLGKCVFTLPVLSPLQVFAFDHCFWSMDESNVPKYAGESQMWRLEKKTEKQSFTQPESSNYVPCKDLLQSFALPLQGQRSSLHDGRLFLHHANQSIVQVYMKFAFWVNELKSTRQLCLYCLDSYVCYSGITVVHTHLSLCLCIYPPLLHCRAPPNPVKSLSSFSSAAVSVTSS